MSSDASAGMGDALEMLRRVSLLEAALRASEREAFLLRRENRELSRHAAVVEATTDFVGMASVQGKPTYINPAGRRLVGLPSEGSLPESIAELHPAWAQKIILGTGVPAAIRDGVWRGQTAVLCNDGRELPTSQVIIAHREADSGEVEMLSTVMRDLTDVLFAEEERVRLKEDIIRAQAGALRELSTPLAPIADGVVAMPLVGSMDERRADQVLETLLTGVRESAARFAILDITGVPVVDTQVAAALLRAARAVRLLGAKVILTGVRSEVARTLVSLGVDLGSIVTRSTLQAGIAFAMRASAR
jgi:rsbT co-antagonist protein RsbR